MSALVYEDWESPRWRLEHLYYILDDQGREVQFTLRPEQAEFLDAWTHRSLTLKARQLGISTLVSLMQLDACLFNRNYTAATICDTEDNAKKMFRTKVSYPWSRLPVNFRKQIGLKAESVGEMQWGNGSTFSISTSARSTTLQSLHISEYGRICAKYPEKAVEIKSGSIPAVVQNGMIVIESTAAGHEGDFYEMVVAAKQRQDQAKPLTQLDFKLHFFPWWKKPTNVLNDTHVVVPPTMLAYFKALKEKHGIQLSPKQQAWYVKTQEVLGNMMKAEHPSAYEEAFEASVEGAIFQNEMAHLRKMGRIGRFPWKPQFPVNTFWDFGISKSSGTTAVWFHQRINGLNRLIGVLNEANMGIGWWVNQLHGLPYTYGRHFMPHDARSRMQGNQVATREQLFNDAGIYNISVVPRVSEIAIGIEKLRTFLMSCEFDEQGCADGIKALDSYRREWDEKSGRWSDRPLHNAASDLADALRQGAQGYEPEEQFTPFFLEAPEILDAEVGF